MADWDRFALGLVGALQAAEDRDMRQQSLDRQDKLLQIQLANADVDRDYKKAHADYYRAQTAGDEAMKGFNLGSFFGDEPAQGQPQPTTPPPASPQPGVKPTSMNPEDVNQAVAVLPPELRNVAIQEIAKSGLSPALVAAIPKMVRQESSGQQFRPDGTVLTSPKGARGIFQIMPDTAKDLGIDPDDPAQNVQGGIRYLAQMEKQFKDPSLALAAYNAGPGAVARAGGIPQFKETQDYVKNVRAGLPTGSYDVAAGGNQASDAFPVTPSAPKATGVPLPQVNTSRDPEMEALQRLEGQREKARAAVAAMPLTREQRRAAEAQVESEFVRRRQGVMDALKLRTDADQKNRDNVRQDVDISLRVEERNRNIIKDRDASKRQAEQDAAKGESDRLESWNKLAKDYTYEPIEDGMSDPEKTQKQQRNQMRASALNTILTRLDNKWRFQAGHRAEVASMAADLFKETPDADAVFKAVDNEVNLRTPEGMEHRQGIEDARNGARAGRSERNAVRDSRGWGTRRASESGAIQDEPEDKASPIPAPSAQGLPVPNTAITSGEERLRERGGIKPTPREMVALALAEDPEEQNLRERRRLDMEFLRGFPVAAGEAVSTLGRGASALPQMVGKGLAGLVQKAMPERVPGAEVESNQRDAMYQHFKPIIDQYRRTNDPVTKARMLERARSQGIDLEELMIGAGR